jgi:hypothetical protein
VDRDRGGRQLRLIAEIAAYAARLDVEVWLRGGWAMDFFLGEITRDHADIDWFAWASDAQLIKQALHDDGFVTVGGPPVAQQLDVVRDGEESSFAWLATDNAGRIVVAGGPWAGQPWPTGMLAGPMGRLGHLRCPIISPAAQIEIKQMMPIWDPGRRRRPKDVPDITRLTAALRG